MHNGCMRLGGIWFYGRFVIGHLRGCVTVEKAWGYGDFKLCALGALVGGNNAGM